ncbi:F-box/kelch-repeat protein At1g23390-like [Phragmites australis]|uniref:F-box/kelch-repeat protein At1g23390-like n=1 Tax=Phragmites australis TaxID=29695 RepID=UPI002D793D8C|nr:F-box/kelch-repeat protein At1g23390-like [Phragmites australis]
MGVRGHEVKQRRHQEGCEDDGASLAAMYLHGDVLESVVARVPAADLAATARVSREWLRAVRATLRWRPRRLPWLVVHLQGSGRRSTAAYDPNSGAWFTVPATRHATPSHVRLLRGARGDRVCAISLSGLDVAGGPLGTAACVVLKAPSVWRVDPVFAAVGDRVVALGGACQLALAEGEDAAAVEVHEGGGWTACEPMPDALRESAAATWLSAAATDQRVYLVERTTGWASWFDPANRRWGPSHRLVPDAAVSTWGVAPGRAGADERLVLFGAKRADMEAECRVVVQAWEVNGDTLEPTPALSNDAMPIEMSERLFPCEDEDGEEEDLDDTPPSIGVCGYATGGYVYNAAEPANGAVLYELREGKADGSATAVARWEWVPCAPALRAEPLGRAILACSPVGLDQLALGVGSAGPRACTASHCIRSIHRRHLQFDC